MPPAQPGWVSPCPVPWGGSHPGCISVGRGDRNGGVRLPSEPRTSKQPFPRSMCRWQLVPVIRGGLYRTCDGVVGERLDVDEIVMWAVLLQPFAHILLGPEHHWLGQAAQRGAGVVDAIVVAGTALWGAGREGVSRIRPREEENASARRSAHGDGGDAGCRHGTAVTPAEFGFALSGVSGLTLK